MESEDGLSTPSTPVTPATPGAPLFGSFRHETSKNNRKSSLLKSCNCFNGVESLALEDGIAPPFSCALPSPPISLARKVGAELTGTLILIFSGTATAIVNQKTNGSEALIGQAASTGLAVMIVIFSTGHISGAHLNPSVTIAFAALGHFPWKHVPVYIGAQVLASIMASFMLKIIFHPIIGGGVTVPEGGYAQAFALEFIITFNLMFVVTAVATDTRAVHMGRSIGSWVTDCYKDPDTSSAAAVGELAGIAVGATVMLNILIAG
ncbi:Aquaporin NIP6-1 [Orobanche minor]